MAAADLNLSRRALLGAAFAAPVLGAEEGGAPNSLRDDSFAVTEWDRALAGFRRSEATVLALEGGPDENAFGAAHDRFNVALRRLFAIHAPDISALAEKLEIAVAAELADLAFAPPDLDALAGDARRLSFGDSYR